MGFIVTISDQTQRGMESEIVHLMIITNSFIWVRPYSWVATDSNLIVRKSLPHQMLFDYSVELTLYDLPKGSDQVKAVYQEPMIIMPQSAARCGLVLIRYAEGCTWTGVHEGVWQCYVLQDCCRVD